LDHIEREYNFFHQAKPRFKRRKAGPLSYSECLFRPGSLEKSQVSFRLNHPTAFNKVLRMMRNSFSVISIVTCY